MNSRNITTHFERWCYRLKLDGVIWFEGDLPTNLDDIVVIAAPQYRGGDLPKPSKRMLHISLTSLKVMARAIERPGWATDAQGEVR